MAAATIAVLGLSGCGDDAAEPAMSADEEAYYVGYQFGLADMCASARAMPGPMPSAYDDSSADDPGQTAQTFNRGYRVGYDRNFCD